LASETGSLETASSSGESGTKISSTAPGTQSSRKASSLAAGPGKNAFHRRWPMPWKSRRPMGAKRRGLRWHPRRTGATVILCLPARGRAFARHARVRRPRRAGWRSAPRRRRINDPGSVEPPHGAGHWYRRPPIRMLARNGPIPTRSEPQAKTAKPSKTIRANKRMAKLKAKHRRQRARATA
jgi:hypothetical protein